MKIDVSAELIKLDGSQNMQSKCHKVVFGTLPGGEEAVRAMLLSMLGHISLACDWQRLFCAMVPFVLCNF